MRKALLINLSFDKHLRRMKSGRRHHLINGPQVSYLKLLNRYERLMGQQHLLSAVQQKQVEEGPIHSLLILSHGLPNSVLLDDSEQNFLLSSTIESAALSTLANGRDIYICACRVAENPSTPNSLVNKLIECGANSVVAFKKSPKWNSIKGLRLWQDIDSILCRAVAETGGKKGAVNGKNAALSRVHLAISHTNNNRYIKELKTTESVVKSMVILKQ